VGKLCPFCFTEAVGTETGLYTYWYSHWSALNASEPGFARPGDTCQGRLDHRGDPACLGSSQIDGRTLMEVCRTLGLHLGPADNAVEAGITEVWNLLVSGRLKVMASLTNWLGSFANTTAMTKDRLWVGCIAGALRDHEYVAKLAKAGFDETDIEPTHVYDIEDARAFLTGQVVDVDAIAPQVEGKFMSAFIRARKPASCCPPDAAHDVLSANSSAPRSCSLPSSAPA